MTLPSIIYGTAWKKERTVQLVIAAVLQGFRTIDTACQPKHYREDLVGEALGELYGKHGIKREDLFLQTKFTPLSGQDKQLPYKQNASVRDQVLESFQTSLKQLRTEYIDSYILHSPLETLGKTMDAWRTLMELQDNGKVKLIGLSNTYNTTILESLGELRKVQVVQNRWFEGNSWDKDVFKYCRDHDIMYQSFWTLTGSPSLLEHPAILTIAQEASCTPAQAVYRVAQLRGIVPLAGSTNEGRMRDGVATSNIELKSPASIKALEDVNKFIESA
ncbi:hypothetical protein M422DRAFT_59353 [Sphaerobolus stellatus SS14]|nr:hypothetical protein M422DRAFT_59353 [Sphaerobolus stellatus SS14]